MCRSSSLVVRGYGGLRAPSDRTFIGARFVNSDIFPQRRAGTPDSGGVPTQDHSTVPAKHRKLLASPLFSRIGPANHEDDDTECWWAEHRPLVVSWLREKLEQTEDEFTLEQMRFAATALISTPDVRGWGVAPGMPDREPLCWDELDAYEVLFEHLAMGGLCDGWSAALVGESVADFAAYLGRQGVLDKDHAEDLAADFEAWVPNFVDYFERGRWYNRPRERSVAVRDA